ncbi:MAG: magnesium transporter [Candidatus Kapaibacterium sp.]
MLKELMKPEITELIENRRWHELKGVFASWPPPEIADLLLDIEYQDRAVLFRLLPRDLAADVFSYLEHEDRDVLLRDLNDQETKRLLADMSPDDRTDLFEELPAKVTRRLLNLLNPDDLIEARQLLGYPEESVGRKMTPDFVAVRPDWSIARALEHIRQFGRDSETIYRIYVTEKDGRLLDDIVLKKVILASADSKISELMDHNVASLSAFDDQEEAVRMMERYDLFAIPVVDSQGMLVGIVTHDDVFDISEEEATEDFHKISGMNPVEQTYLSASVWKMWIKRFPWLLALLLANFITAGVITHYESVVQSVVILAAFIPLLIGTAGNSGTQSATLIIRSLAIDEVGIRDWLRVLRKELAVGLMLGIVLGAITYFRGLFEGDSGIGVAVVISMTMLVLLLWANIIGGLLPLILARFNLDPAVISSPFIATVIDVTGIFIYFNIAIWILGL